MIRITVTPRARSRSISSSTVRPLAASRLPVGSSARRRRGDLTSARASATRCCSPPESLAGQVLGAVGQADLLEGRQRPAPPFRGGDARVEQRKLDVAAGGLVPEQVEALEDESDQAVAHLGELGVGEPGDVPALEVVRADARTVEAAEDVEQRRLPRPGRPGHGEELAGLDAQVEGAERMDREAALPVRAGDAVESDEGLGHVTLRVRTRAGSRAAARRAGTTLARRPRIDGDRRWRRPRTGGRSGRGSPRCGAGAPRPGGRAAGRARRPRGRRGRPRP